MANSTMTGRALALLAYKPAQFAVFGLLLFLYLNPASSRHEAIEPVVIDDARIEALRDGWRGAMGRAPDEQELAGLVRREIDDEVLFREGLARSLHLRDPVVQQRLLLNMRFLGTTGEVSEEQLLREAVDLGMHRNDLIVRRRLVQIMELSIQDGADRSPPSAEELQQMYEQRREELTVPARWRITQVYFSGDRRSDRAAVDAESALPRLRELGAESSEALALGDPFLGGHRLPMLNEMQLAGQFGAAFAAGLVECAAQQWCGPLASSYGFHLVWVHEALPRQLPAIDDPDVQRRIVSDVQRARAEQTLADALVALRQKYGVAS
jgi:hypothetical protein